MPIDSESELLQGVRELYQTADLLYAEQSTGKSIACEQGCTFCCHFHITVKPYELVSLVHFAENLPPEDRERFDSVLAVNREILAQTADDKLLEVNFACPFLMDGSCSVYEMRPLSCRTAHSLSKRVCEQAYLNPEGGVEADIIPEMTESIRAAEDEFEELVGEYCDVSDYNISEALYEALSDPEWITRFIDGEEVFSDNALSRV